MNHQKCILLYKYLATCTEYIYIRGWEDCPFCLVYIYMYSQVPGVIHFCHNENTFKYPIPKNIVFGIFFYKYLDKIKFITSGAY